MRRRVLLASTAAAALSPAMVRAQQKAMPVIGYLAVRSYGDSTLLVAAFQKGLRETGYVERRNVTIEYCWAEGRYDRLPALAAALVDHKVDVIVTGGGASALAAKGATSTIPIVFESGADPVETHLVASLARPGGNLTGFSILVAGLNPKRLELLSEIVPKARVFALLVNPGYSGVDGIVRETQEAARAKGVQLHVLKAATGSEIDAAFANLVQIGAGAVVVANDPFFSTRREQLVALASRNAVPAIYSFAEFATAGGLISYGPSLTAVYRLLGIYAGKILAGAKPADLPVQQPTDLDLVINLKTAKALGLTIPPMMLASTPKIVLQQNLPQTDSCTAANRVSIRSPCRQSRGAQAICQGRVPCPDRIVLAQIVI
jgi:putative ABC transport system substrate-binding protein